MKKEKIVLLTEDREYAEALARTAAFSAPSWDFEIRDAFGPEPENEPAQEGKRPVEKTCQIRGDKLIAGHEFTYRYQRSGKLLRFMGEQLGLEFQSMESARGQGIALYGIGGGTGVSTVTMALARIAAMYHEKKVLVINRSLFGYGLCEAGDRRNGSRVLFDEYEREQEGESEAEDMSSKPKTAEENLEIFRDEYGVYYIGCEKGINGYALGNSEDAEKLEINLIDRLNPDLTIWDMGALTPEACNMTTQIRAQNIGVSKGKLAEEKILAFEELAGRDFFDFHIVNMAEGEMEEVAGGGNVFYLEADPKHEDLDYAFGRGISLIAENVL